ncbi:MAG TPA: phosphotransferase [Solirubrobacteraceae bacterium]|nr:phosphotransferase [Solirubrobacteraceae bacterium]
MREPARLDGLGWHLEDRYGIEVTGITPLDIGVVRVDRGDGQRWVARVFGAERPLVTVREDAAILRGLERAGFPAERCAHPEPVSEFLGQSVLVTTFLEDHGPLRPGRPAGILGALLGRLHAHPVPDIREGGAWHHLSSAGGPREEIAAAAQLLDDHLPRVGVRELALLDRLRDEVARTDDCHDLPHAFVHPDFAPANAISTADGKLAIVDWTGAGRGPRLWSIGFLLWAAGARDLRLVDLVVSRYRRSAELEPAELDRLAGAIRGRPVMLEIWSVCAGRRELAVAVDRVERAGELAKSIAVCAQRAFATPIYG